MDFLGENVFLSFGALFMVIFIGWVWKPDAVLAEVEKNGAFAQKRLWLFLLRFVAPAATFFVALTSLGIL